MTLQLLVAVAGGALLSAALPPTGFWPLLAALAPLFGMVAAAPRPRDALGLGFAFGLGFFSLHVLWLPASFSLPSMFGPGFWALFPPLVLILALFWGLVTGLARLVGGRGRGPLWLLPALWVAMEWARTQGYFAFPWGTLGYAWLDSPVAQWADAVGVYGLSLLATTLAALLAAPFVPVRFDRFGGQRGGGLRPLAAAALLAAAAWGGGLLREPAVAPPFTTALLVQPNLDPFARALGPGDEVRVLTRLTRDGVAELAAPPELVVWPEGAVLQGLRGYGGATPLEELQASAPGSTLLVGARARLPERPEESYNAVFSLAEGRVQGRYDKLYLVPFGERWPLYRTARPVYATVFRAFGLGALAQTAPGEGLEPLPTPSGALAAYICYESVFPQVQRRLVAGGAEVLVNVTNDAWFARGNGARQHYDMGRMRAIETRRWLLRAGIDGITGVVDPRGRTLDELERGVAGTLAVRYRPSDELTPWVRYGGLTPWLLAGYALLAGLGLTLARSR